MSTWIKREMPHNPDFDIEDLDGIDWLDAPTPSLFHRCKPQTKGWMGGVRYIQRCACGATRLSERGPWIGKNETRIARLRNA